MPRIEAGARSRNSGPELVVPGNRFQVVDVPNKKRIYAGIRPDSNVYTLRAVNLVITEEEARAAEEGLLSAGLEYIVADGEYRAAKRFPGAETIEPEFRYKDARSAFRSAVDDYIATDHEEDEAHHAIKQVGYEVTNAGLQRLGYMAPSSKRSVERMDKMITRKYQELNQTPEEMDFEQSA
jgi:hypothetical protein